MTKSTGIRQIQNSLKCVILSHYLIKANEQKSKFNQNIIFHFRCFAMKYSAKTNKSKFILLHLKHETKFG
jgi:hypothetical protein